MSVFFYKNKINLNVIDLNYNKIKINYLFLNYNYIIFLNKKIFLKFKNFFLNLNIISINIKKSYINFLFEVPNFNFLKGENVFCIFINNIEEFINTVKILNNIQFFYIYKKSFSNLINNFQILEEFNKYNKNSFIIQFFLKKKIIKLFLLFFFLLISVIKYMK